MGRGRKRVSSHKKTKSDNSVQLSEQEAIDDFLSFSAHPDFRKLYDRLGEKDDFIRNIFDVTFDFSKKKQKHCIAFKIGEYMLCGEPCEDVFCNKHMLQIKELRMIPGPCRVCGVGVINTYCSSCILETRERDKNILLAKEFDDDEPSIGSFGWHLKNQGRSKLN